MLAGAVLLISTVILTRASRRLRTPEAGLWPPPEPASTVGGGALQSLSVRR